MIDEFVVVSAQRLILCNLIVVLNLVEQRLSIKFIIAKIWLDLNIISIVYVDFGAEFLGALNLLMQIFQFISSHEIWYIYSEYLSYNDYDILHVSYYKHEIKFLSGFSALQ